MLLRIRPTIVRLPSQPGAVKPDEGVKELRSHEGKTMWRPCLVDFKNREYRVCTSILYSILECAQTSARTIFVHVVDQKHTTRKCGRRPRKLDNYEAT